MDRVTKVVNTEGDVFAFGRYALGIDDTFKKYPAWAHLVEFNGMEVFTSDKIAVEINCSFQYFIRQVY